MDSHYPFGISKIFLPIQTLNLHFCYISIFFNLQLFLRIFIIVSYNIFCFITEPHLVQLLAENSDYGLQISSLTAHFLFSMV